MRTSFAILLLALLPSRGMAQMISPALSPIVHEDRTITFVLLAPEADSVEVITKFREEPFAAVRDTSGLWSVTVGPFAAGIHFYSFEVNGVRMIDPQNRWIHVGLTPSTSVVLVPGDEPAFYEERDVPRGTVHVHRHRSSRLGDLRGYQVYTPPGYDGNPTTRYPVLYLLHGYSDTEDSWRVSGRVDVILDNLIADGSAKPMIAVMPFGYAPAQEGDAEGDGESQWPDWFGRVTARLQPYIVDELVGLVDSTYRTRAESGSRAVAGLSMGGGQSLAYGLERSDVFGWVGAFSSAVFEPYHDRLLDADRLNTDLSLLWIGCGRDDFLHGLNMRFIEKMNTLGVRHVAHITEGDHSWPIWHGYLREFVSLLFRQ